MTGIYYIYIAAGLLMGSGIAIFAIGIILQKENRMGDSMGGYTDFSNASIHVIQKEKIK